MPQIAVIADDLTGAADTGAMFAAEGLATLVAFGPGVRRAADVLVVSTHSRHLDGEEAAERTRVAAEQVYAEGAPDWWYKKIDSTLRGHPAAELKALMSVVSADRALIAPAFPTQGRTTVGGRQLVDGLPLEETPFADEVETSDVAAFFGEVTAGGTVYRLGLEVVRGEVERICRILASGPALFIADAEVEEDLRRLVGAGRDSGLRLLCGSAGLAQALQDVVSFEPAVEAPHWPSVDGPVLVVAGSRNPRTVRQVEVAQDEGAALVWPHGEMVGVEQSGEVEQIIEYLGAGRAVVLTTAGMELAPLGPQEIAARLGNMVRRALDGTAAGGLVLTGGDVAMGVCAALDSTALWLLGEVEPGIPWGRLADGQCAGLAVVTKAGGFGAERALAKSVHHLRTARE